MNIELLLRKIVNRSLVWIKYPILRPFLSIPTHLTDPEKLCLFKHAASLASSGNRKIGIVEIGSYLGASSCCLAAGLEQTAAAGTVHCIDTWQNDSMTEGNRDTMEVFRKNTSALSHRINPIRGWSTEVVADVANSVDAIDLLFIDGDHSYDGCLADWKSYEPMLVDDAIVVLHDVGWAKGVQRVIDEEIAPHAVAEGRLPNMWWGQINRSAHPPRSV